MRDIRFRAWDKKYEVGSDGSVWSLDYNHTGKRRQLHTYLDQDGYPYVFFNVGKRIKKMVHRLVAELFLDQPTSKHQVNHKNGIRNDARLRNLEWVTSRENTLDGFRRGRIISPTQIESMRKGTIKYNHGRWHQGKECSCIL